MNFVQFAQSHGVEISALRSGDRIWRCPTTTHPKSRNGAYYFDGRRGWVQAWDSGEPVQWWNDANATPWTDADKAEWVRRRNAEQRRIAQRQREPRNVPRSCWRRANTRHTTTSLRRASLMFRQW